MAMPQKFLFETRFEPRRMANAGGIDAFTTVQRELLEAEVQQAYENGRRDGEQSVRESVDADIAVALASLAKSAQAAHDTFMCRLKDLENDAVELAVATANKLARELIESEPTASIEALFEDAIGNLRSTTHIVLHVPEELVRDVESRAAAIAETHGYEGKLVVTGDPKLSSGDCHIEWSDGGVSKSLHDLRRSVVDTIECYLAARHGFFKDLDFDLLEEPDDISKDASPDTDDSQSTGTGLEQVSGPARTISGEGL